MATTTPTPNECSHSRVQVYIRWIIRRDVPEVLAIDAASFSPHPWSEDNLLTFLRSRNHIGMVCEIGQRLFGFMVYELHPRCLKLARLAVDPSARRCGIASQMIEKLQSKMSANEEGRKRRDRITIDVPEGMLGAQLLFRSHAFRAVRVVRGGCAVTGEDVYRMEYRAGE